MGSKKKYNYFKTMVTLPNELHEELELVAIEKDISVSKVVQNVLKKYIKKQNKKENQNG